MITGDLLHHPVQMAQPKWAEIADYDVALAGRRAACSSTSTAGSAHASRARTSRRHRSGASNPTTVRGASRPRSDGFSGSHVPAGTRETPAPYDRVVQRGREAFIGRAAELDVLDAALRRAEVGDGSIVLVAGEPGIGKSSLIDHFATTAPARGARVAWGRCWEAGGAPAYWPFVQAMRAIVRDVDIETVRPWMDSGGSELGQILPEVRTSLGESTPSATFDPDTPRFVLFDAVASFLRAVASASPLVVALDDVHGADTPSLLLLEFLARELRDAAASRWWSAIDQPRSRLTMRSRRRSPS